MPASPGSYLFSLAQRVHAARYPGEQLMPANPGSYLFSLAQRVHCCSLPWGATDARKSRELFILTSSKSALLLATLGSN